MQPPVERGSGDAKILGDLSPGYLERFHMPKDEKPFANGVSGVLPSLGELFLKDRDLHFELVNLVFQKEDFLGFGVGVHGGESFQTSSSDPSQESSRQQGGFDEK